MRIELLRSAGCPNAARVRAMVDSCLAELGIVAPVNERVGAYASPSVLVDGVDVVARPPGGHERPCCRLDLPDRDQLRTALRRAAPEDS